MSRGYCHKASKRSRQSKPCEPISAIEFMPWGHTWWSCLKFHASLYQYIRFIFDPSVFDLHCTTYTYKLFWTTTHYVSSELQDWNVETYRNRLEMVFCYHNCADLLWKKNCSRKYLFKYWKVRTIFGLTEWFFNLFLEVSHM